MRALKIGGYISFKRYKYYYKCAYFVLKTSFAHSQMFDTIMRVVQFMMSMSYVVHTYSGVTSQ